MNDGRNDGRKQLAVWIGVALVLLLGIYPPWIRSRHSYDWLFVRANGGARVDLARLLVEWIMVAVIVGAFYFAPFKLRREKLQGAGVMPEPPFQASEWVAVTVNHLECVGLMPGCAFREMARLYPDPARSAYPAQEWFDDPENDPQFPCSVELRNGNFAYFGTPSEAEDFKVRHPLMFRQT